MSSRKRASTPLFGERLSTKKEKENDFTPTCPPLNRKRDNSRYTRWEDYTTHPIQCLGNTHLSSLYNKAKNLPYIKQVFSIEDQIGEGSYGCVYRVRSLKNDKPYAVKIMRFNKNDPKVGYAEVKRHDRLGNHPNLIKLINAWEDSLHLYIQMELYETSLDKYAKANHNICEDQLWDILIDMLMALKHLHEKQFVHLDVKPANIMISSDGTYKLGDFGLLVDLFEIRKEREGFCRLSDGDAKYLAREVLEEHYTTAADVFSLGITMLELATDLVLPSNGPLWHDIRNGVLPEQFTKAIPTALLRIIRTMTIENHLSRPTIAQLLKVEPIKTKIAESQLCTRVNHYQQWCINNPTPPEEPIPRVDLYLRVHNKEDRLRELDYSLIEQNRADFYKISTSDRCVTPPRRISHVAVYTL